MKKEFIGSLIGSFIKITNSENKALLNLQGKIIDETEHTIKLQTNDKIKKIIKNQVKFEIKNES